MYALHRLHRTLFSKTVELNSSNSSCAISVLCRLKFLLADGVVTGLGIYLRNPV